MTPELESYARRFAVFAFTVAGYDSLDDERQQVCRDAATWVLRALDAVTRERDEARKDSARLGCQKNTAFFGHGR